MTIGDAVMWVRTRGQKAITVALNFVRENTPESSTRLVMILFGVTACVIGVGALRYAFVRLQQVHELELLAIRLAADSKPVTFAIPELGVPMVVALGGVATLFIGSGAVAIALRTKKKLEPGDPDPRSALDPAPGVPS
jgi:hypothetical protein